MHEFGWAWRGVRGRGWRGVLVIALVAVALAANTIVFVTADSFVFNRAPYPDSSRLVEIGWVNAAGWTNSVLPDAVPVWRSFTDLFAEFHTYQSGFPARAYLTGGDGPQFVADAAVTPGLLDILGAQPIAGRLFVNDDAHAPPNTAAIVAEEIAIQQFGDPRRALGQTLTVGTDTPRIIGVLPAAFRFPSGAERIWTPLEMASVPPNNGSRTIARMAPGMRLDALAVAVRNRSATVQSHLSPPWDRLGQTVEARSILQAQVDPRVKRIFLFLCGAAGCLLLVACANVVNVELATALVRSRTYAVQIALGASRGTLVRTALLEAAIAVMAAAALAAVLVFPGMAFLSSRLPTAMTSALAHGLGFDWRAFLFMVSVALAAWLITSLPVAFASFRTGVIGALKLDGAMFSTSRSGMRLRQGLTIAEVGMTVLLLVGALLSVRSYAALLAIPKGFDTNGVVWLTVRQAPRSHETDRDLQERLLAAIRSRSDIVNATVVGASPPGGGGSIASDMTVVGRPSPAGHVTLGVYDINLDYFKAMRLPLKSGREFEADDPPGDVIVDEGFARRYWPNGDALGRGSAWAVRDGAALPSSRSSEWPPTCARSGIPCRRRATNSSRCTSGWATTAPTCRSGTRSG